MQRGNQGSKVSREKCPPDEGSVRSCLVCRTKRSRHALLDLGLVDGHAVLSRVKGGRGAHVCPTWSCLTRMTSKDLARAFRVPVAELDSASWVEHARKQAERHVLDAVGLARRMGILEIGVELINRSPRSQGVVLAASDLAERSRRALPDGVLSPFLGDELGRAAGTGWLGAVRIPAGPLAQRAATWLGLWYECRPSESAETGANRERRGLGRGPAGLSDDTEHEVE